MGDARELYQELILEHSKSPRNFRVLEDANLSAEGDNPLCGDQCHVYLKIDGGTIADVGFQGSGCAISKASASIMTQEVKGKPVADAEKLTERFHAMVTGKAPAPPEFGRLAVFEGVREFPARVKCASLAWHTLRAALKQEKDKVSTE